MNITATFTAECDRCDWSHAAQSPDDTRTKAALHVRDVHDGGIRSARRQATRRHPDDADRDGWFDWAAWEPGGVGKRLRAAVRSLEQRGFGTPWLSGREFRLFSTSGAWSGRPWHFAGQVSPDCREVSDLTVSVGSAQPIMIGIEQDAEDDVWAFLVPEGHGPVRSGWTRFDRTAASGYRLMPDHLPQTYEQAKAAALGAVAQWGWVSTGGDDAPGTVEVREWTTWTDLPDEVDMRVARRLRQQFAVTAARERVEVADSVWVEADSAEYHDLHGGPVATLMTDEVAMVTLHDCPYGRGSLTGDAQTIGWLAYRGAEIAEQWTRSSDEA